MKRVYKNIKEFLQDNLSFRSVYCVLHSLLCIPSILFHELSHKIYADILFLRYHYIFCEYFFELEKNIYCTKLNTYYFYVQIIYRQTKINASKAVLVNTSPVTSVLALLGLLYSYCSFNVFLTYLIYVIYTHETSLMSTQDMSDLKNNLLFIFKNIKKWIDKIN